MIRVMIGYDERESIAYHVLAQSIMDNASEPVSITPLNLKNLPMYTRTHDGKQSTAFSYSRFLVPYLCDYEGHAIFMDCDMLCLGDIAELWAMRPVKQAVAVVKHDYTPSTETKFMDQVQTKYEKKNWSSMMLFNNKFCRGLTPEFINLATGLQLHQFYWCDTEIAEIPLEWNWLVGEYGNLVTPKLLHYTIGGPWFKEYKNCDYADEWFEYWAKSNGLECEK